MNGAGQSKVYAAAPLVIRSRHVLTCVDIVDTFEASVLPVSQINPAHMALSLKWLSSADFAVDSLCMQCRVGDVVRATSAMTMQMVYPTINVMFGGVGRPSLVKILLPADSSPFSKVMDAVRSNSEPQGGDGSIVLVLERDSGAAQGSAEGLKDVRDCVGADVGAAESAASGEENGSDMFDPRIFETMDK